MLWLYRLFRNVKLCSAGFALFLPAPTFVFSAWKGALQKTALLLSAVQAGKPGLRGSGASPVSAQAGGRPRSGSPSLLLS